MDASTPFAKLRRRKRSEAATLFPPMARLCGWDGKPQTEFNITNQVGVVCDEATRMRLIKLREKMQAERTVPITLPAPQTKLEQASVCMGNGIPAAGEPIEKPGPAFSAPVGAIAPSDASPTYRAWLEHEKAEPEPGSEYEI